MVATVLSQANLFDKPQDLHRLRSHLWPSDTLTVDLQLELGVLRAFACNTAASQLCTCATVQDGGTVLQLEELLACSLA